MMISLVKLWLSLFKSDQKQDLRVLPNQKRWYRSLLSTKIRYPVSYGTHIVKRRARLVFLQKEFLKESSITANITVNIQNNHTRVCNNPEAMQKNKIHREREMVSCKMKRVICVMKETRSFSKMSHINDIVPSTLLKGIPGLHCTDVQS